MDKKKNVKKIIISVIGVLGIIVLLFPLVIYIYPNFSPLWIKGYLSRFSYTVYEDHVVVRSYFGKADVVVVPERFLGREVTIVDEWFGYDNDTIRKVVLPNTIEEIRPYAFKKCNNLTEVVLSSNLQIIGESAFRGCSSMKKINIPEADVTIDHGAFASCSSLEEVILPETELKINEWAFAGCSSLKKIIIPETVGAIGEAAFCNCSSLEEVVLPDIVHVKDSAFKNTPWQESMTEEFVIIGNGTLVKYNGNDKSVYIPEKVKCIANYIFEEENQPETIIISENVEYICEDALRENSLKYVILQGNDTELEDEFVDVALADHLITIVSAEGSTGQRYVEEHPDEMLTWMSLEEYETLQNE